jgi:hypothetical protein
MNPNVLLFHGSYKHKFAYYKPLEHFPTIFFFKNYSVKTNLNSGGAVSRLYVANANRLDSGNYTCSLGESAKTTIAVHVLNGR